MGGDSEEEGETEREKQREREKSRDRQTAERGKGAHGDDNHVYYYHNCNSRTLTTAIFKYSPRAKSCAGFFTNGNLFFLVLRSINTSV